MSWLSEQLEDIGTAFSGEGDIGRHFEKYWPAYAAAVAAVAAPYAVGSLGPAVAFAPQLGSAGAFGAKWMAGASMIGAGLGQAGQIMAAGQGLASPFMRRESAIGYPGFAQIETQYPGFPQPYMPTSQIGYSATAYPAEGYPVAQYASPSVAPSLDFSAGTIYQYPRLV